MPLAEQHVYAKHMHMTDDVPAEHRCYLRCKYGDGNDLPTPEERQKFGWTRDRYK